MSTINASVGRGGTNRPDDIRLVQSLLNRSTYPPVPPLGTDGIMGPRTIAAIEAFQKNAVGMIQPDGRVDPGGKTLAALNQEGTATVPAMATDTGLPPAQSGTPLAATDFERSAKVLGCEVACIQAVNKVESAGSGFFPSGRPKILFEAHIFSRLTQHRYDTSHPAISSAKWNKALYAGGEREYDRLQRAMALDHGAALQSASWGRFQIMGSNFQLSGFLSVDAFVEAMFASEGRQLDAFVSFVQKTRLDGPLREKRWADFAKGYNGPAYAQNSYDTKLREAYSQFSRSP